MPRPRFIASAPGRALLGSAPVVTQKTHPRIRCVPCAAPPTHLSQSKTTSSLPQSFSKSFRSLFEVFPRRASPSCSSLQPVGVSTAPKGARLRGHAGQEDQQKRLARSLLASLSAHEMGFLQGGHHVCRSNVAMAHGPDLDK